MTAQSLHSQTEETPESLEEEETEPKWIYELLLNPPLLPGENLADFERLFDNLRSHVNAKTPPEYHIVYEITALTWDVIRYQRMKVNAIVNQRRAAAEAMFRKTHGSALLKGANAIVNMEASENAEKWFADESFRDKKSKGFEAAGYSSEAIETEAFLRSLPAVSAIDRLIASSQKRLSAFLKDLEKRCADRAAKLGNAAKNAIESA